MVRPRPDPRRRHRAANVSLDLIGQARLLYQLVATLKGGECTEDKLAYFRDAHEFRNYTLLELPHHGPLVGYARRPRLRHHHRAQLPVQRADGAVWEALEKSADADLAAIAAKSLKEVRYHLHHARDWLVRLGDGTDESHARVQAALDHLCPTPRSSGPQPGRSRRGGRRSPST
jgi:ring-1,2-phenylacetyl-CoA epoxidase subunit PaaC